MARAMYVAERHRWRHAMQQRHVRVHTPWLTVEVDGEQGDVVNLSVTGAMFALDGPVPVGRHVDVRLKGDSLKVTVKAAVVRSDPSESAPGWRVAVRFLD